MNAYRTKWKNGEVSIVLANTMNDAILILDEVDDPSLLVIEKIPIRAVEGLMFTLGNTGEYLENTRMQELALYEKIAPSKTFDVSTIQVVDLMLGKI